MIAIKILAVTGRLPFPDLILKYFFEKWCNVREVQLILKWVALIKASSTKKWYLPVAAFFTFMDAFIPVVPNEAFLVLAVLPRPKKWFDVSALFAFASALGATALAALISFFGQPVILYFFPELLHSQTWQNSIHWMQVNGAWGLSLVALSPFPQHGAVAILGLAHSPLAIIFLSVFMGRFLKYGLVAWCAVHSPNILRKLKVIT